MSCSLLLILFCTLVFTMHILHCRIKQYLTYMLVLRVEFLHLVCFACLLSSDQTITTIQFSLHCIPIRRRVRHSRSPRPRHPYVPPTSPHRCVPKNNPASIPSARSAPLFHRRSTEPPGGSQYSEASASGTQRLPLLASLIKCSLLGW